MWDTSGAISAINLDWARPVPRNLSVSGFPSPHERRDRGRSASEASDWISRKRFSVDLIDLGVSRVDVTNIILSE